MVFTLPTYFEGQNSYPARGNDVYQRRRCSVKVKAIRQSDPS